MWKEQQSASFSRTLKPCKLYLQEPVNSGLNVLLSRNLDSFGDNYLAKLLHWSLRGKIKIWNWVE